MKHALTTLAAALALAFATVATADMTNHAEGHKTAEKPATANKAAADAKKAAKTDAKAAKKDAKQTAKDAKADAKEAPVDMAAGMDLARKNACMSCHAEDKKIVGPSYKDVATKYKGDKTAEAKLIKKVKEGGSGVWGPVPMPPNPQVKDEDVKTLVRWILAH